jgi:co-chaperonin GroES (HSP10)
VHIESFPDDYRKASLDYNLTQTLIIPDFAKEPSRLAKVLALGSGDMQDGERYEFSVEPGDIVLCPRYPQSCQVIKRSNGEVITVMREEEIIAKVVTNGKAS